MENQCRPVPLGPGKRNVRDSVYRTTAPMNYSPYGGYGVTPKWRWGVYCLILAIITILFGHEFGKELYWGIPIGVGFLLLFFFGVNWLVRNPERRASLAPYAKWLILAGILGNIILFIWKHYNGR